MSASLLMSSSVRALGVRVSVTISGLLVVAWLAGITIYWYQMVIPAINESAGDSSQRRDNLNVTSVDNRLPVTLITGFLGSGMYRFILKFRTESIYSFYFAGQTIKIAQIKKKKNDFQSFYKLQGKQH